MKINTILFFKLILFCCFAFSFLKAQSQYKVQEGGSSQTTFIDEFFQESVCHMKLKHPSLNYYLDLDVLKTDRVQFMKNSGIDELKFFFYVFIRASKQPIYLSEITTLLKDENPMIPVLIIGTIRLSTTLTRENLFNVHLESAKIPVLDLEHCSLSLDKNIGLNIKESLKEIELQIQDSLNHIFNKMRISRFNLSK